MKLVIIESPYAGEITKNFQYLSLAIKDSLARGEAPFASHGFYTLHLDDFNFDQREQGMNAGWAWMAKADLIAVYQDRGISPGMQRGIAKAQEYEIKVVYRNLGQFKPR